MLTDQRFLIGVAVGAAVGYFLIPKLMGAGSKAKVSRNTSGG